MKNSSLHVCKLITLVFALLSTALHSYSQCILPNPTVNNASTTCGQTVTLTASGGINYNWYSNAAGSQFLGSGASYITPVLTTNTTYYVQAVSGVANNLLQFTNCSATGETGPTLAQMTAAYAGTSLAGLVTSSTQGIQEWTVPTTGTYTITAAGAKGGDANNAIGGSGRSITITTTLTQGHVIKILVGQQGGNLNFTTGWAGGGGGGTFLYNQTTNQLILVAGGGGGAAQGSPTYPYTQNGLDASSYNNTSGSNGTMSGGSWCQGGNGGSNGSGGGGIGGSGGAGWLSNGTAGYYGLPGIMFSSGGLGGVNFSACGNWNTSTNGGFGGGAGAGMCTSYEANGGGGGGYSGGGGGACRVGAGGGGGCFFTGTYVSESLNAGHGLVDISYAGVLCTSALVPATVTVNANINNPVVSNAVVSCNQSATLTATGANNYNWYSNANGAQLLGTGATYITPLLNQNTTYYVQSTAGVGNSVLNFTNCGATGENGPTLAQMTSAYTGTSLAGLVSSSIQGIQEWTVPSTGTYTITAAGAKGGDANNAIGGSGRSITITTPLTQGHVIKILVGQQGGNLAFSTGWAGGGGGGTFVYNQTTNQLIVAAGGGGGAGKGDPNQYNFTLNGGDGSVYNNTSGGTGINCPQSWCSAGSGGANGAGGLAGGSPNNQGGAAGSGWNSQGSTGTYGGAIGQTFNQGGLGGVNQAACGNWTSSNNGGFGGGGGAGMCTNYEALGGGGGGYSGGGGAGCRVGAGGGGGSYYTGTFVTEGLNAGHGLVTVSFTGVVCSSPLIPVVVTVNSNINTPTVSNAAISCGQTATLVASGVNNYIWAGDSLGTQILGNSATYTTPNLTTTTTYYVQSSAGVGNSVLNFTNCGATGENGPTLAQMTSAYTGTSLAGLVNSSTQGIQEWTVPSTGTYTITAAGAKGGDANNAIGGSGRSITITTTLTQGHVIKILVGQQGGNLAFSTGWAGGGGGGTFVYNQTTNQLIVAAGGGGGAGKGDPNQYNFTLNGGDGSVYNNTSGGTGINCPQSWCSAGSGGANGAGGLAGGSPNNQGGAAGSGWNSQGSTGTYGGAIGQTFNQGGLGGVNQAACGNWTSSNNGGFGGGGGAGMCTNYEALGGGGGGYSGGGGAGCRVGAGGGGGSYYTGTFVSEGLNAGHGLVNINYNGVVCYSPFVPVTVTVNGIQTPSVAGNLNLCGNGNNTTTLVASGSPAGYAWWSNANGTGSLGNSASYTTPAINTTTTYYVQSINPQGGSQVFSYTGSAQTFTAPVSGVYTLEAWGAQGGNDPVYPNTALGGRGGYAKGDVYLAAGSTIYVYVGEQGSGCMNSTWKSTGGGGATDFRLSGGLWNDNAGLYSRIVVAGGGGGRHGTNYENALYVGNDGGGLSAPSFVSNSTSITGSNQTSGGASNYGSAVVPGSFGFATPNNQSNSCSLGGWNGGARGSDNWANGGAGGGWYGGCTSWPTSSGGSGYVYTSSSFIPAGYTPVAAYQLTNTQLIAGDATMPDINGNLVTGNSGNGNAKISWSGTGCSSSIVPVTVIAGQSPTVTAGANQSICSGTSITLNGSGAATYSWDNNVQNGVAFTPNTTQTYTVTGTAANGCTNTAQVTVTVNALPTVSGGQNQTVCAGNPVILAGSGASSYAWNNNVQNGVAFTPNTTQTYTVTGTTANGCTNTAQVTVTVNALPTVSGGQNQTVCAGNPVTLAGSGASSYAWNNNVQNGVAFTPNTTQTYTVTGTAANGCTNTAQVTVTVNALPTVSGGQNQTVCAGNPVILAGSGASSYAWNNNVQNGVAFTPNTTQTYTVTGTTANGCTNTAQVTVTVNALPTVSGGQNQTVCAGNPVTLAGSGASSYAWNNNVQNGVAFTPNTTQTYTVTGTAANGCTNTAQVQVTVNPLPTVSLGNDTLVCEYNFPITIQANGNANLTYTWNNGSLGQSLLVNGAGTYDVTASDNNGCSATDDIIIESDPCAGIVEHEIGIQLYPNPFNENVIIHSTESIDAHLEVYGSDGRVVFAMEMTGDTATINLATLARGNYVVKILYNGKTQMTKLIKQ